MALDFSELKARISIEDLISNNYGVELKKDGQEWKACCPFHTETTASFTVNDGKYYCFGCGAGGDHLSFIEQYEGLANVSEAGKRLAELTGGGNSPPPAVRAATQRAPKEPKRPEWVPVVPAPQEEVTALLKRDNKGKLPAIYNPKRDTNPRFKPDAVYEYGTPEGVTGFVLRIVMDDGKKLTPQITYATNSETGEQRWIMGSMPEPRPLYRLHSLSNAGTVLIPEGEKAADALASLLPEYAVLAWVGGGKATSRTDWAPLAGRSVALLRDNDAPGEATMNGYWKENGEFKEGIAQQLQALGCKVRIVEPPEGKPKGWDVADEQDWDGDAALAYIKAGLREPQAATPPVPDDEVPPNEMPPEEYDSDQWEPPEDFEAPPEEAPPFRFLGFAKGTAGTVQHYFMARGSRQVLAYSAGGMSKNALLELAPLRWWENRFEPTSSRSAYNYEMAVNYLVQCSSATGIYNAELTRGRGAWWDEGRAAIHLGGEVVIGGVRHAVEEVESRYIYELSDHLPVSFTDPLPASESHKLVEICDRITWEKPVNARLLAGWIVCATVCGALKWRPHIWVTGSAGTGKSTVMDNVVRRTLGPMALFVQGETTEAGLRQRLGSDALPVLFDEAESERKNAAARMDNVLSLVTQASSDNSASIIKGTAGGKALAYKVRSCFAFSSIGVNLKQHAARTRVTVLGLRMNRAANSRQLYEELLGMIESTLTESYVERLHARVIRLIPAIRANAETFSNAGSEVLGSKRMGDQIGALLAGAYALHSDGEITEADARAWIEGQDWSEETALEEQTDEHSCMAYLLESLVNVTIGSHRTERSIGELVAIAGSAAFDDQIGAVDADDNLKRYGMKVDAVKKELYISNTHIGLRKILRDTAWEQTWSRTLKRVTGSSATPSPVRFSSGTQSRAVVIPIAIALGAEAAEAPAF